MQCDVLVIGGGHAGVEAVFQACKLVPSVILLSIDPKTIGQMPCNPAIGGIGKGQLVKELAVFGSVMAQAIDQTGLQFRRLNTKKGPAVQSTRAQADNVTYPNYIQQVLAGLPALKIVEGEAQYLNHLPNEIYPFEVISGKQMIRTKAVVICAGTFLNGLVHLGPTHYSSGRRGELPAAHLSNSLFKLGHEIIRLKTGTCPRIHGASINFALMDRQEGDADRPHFSHAEVAPQNKLPCHITYTNEETHQIIRDNIHLSAMYGGFIEGKGPRYCPSIEDKVVRFADKDRHQIFVEPQSEHSDLYYINGISTSLPLAVQIKIIRSMRGLENAQLIRPGYAIEYDAYNPRDLNKNLMSRFVPGLFFAGQVNGTSGYEEAAAQGFVAGVNAALLSQNQAPDFIPQRHEAYIGVMLDDLVRFGISEPYRMFTSRAEYRLSMREDNCVFRLFDMAKEYKLLSFEECLFFDTLVEQKNKLVEYLRSTNLQKNTPLAERLTLLGLTVSQYAGRKLAELVKVTEMENLAMVAAEYLEQNQVHPIVQENVFNEFKYEGYISKQKDEVLRLTSYHKMRLHLDESDIKNAGMRNEVKEKYLKTQPKTLLEFTQIEGVSPTDVALIISLNRLKSEHSRTALVQ